MCGIIGYKGKEDASKIVLNGLKKLDYRGYDSWGIATVNKDLEVIKRVGRIDENIKINRSGIAIGHTRWATHGNVTEENAHPHLSSDNRIAVVHNGIIENYQQLRRYLKNKGYSFRSETDTEVIPLLIEDFMKEYEYEEAIIKALKMLVGNFAVIITCKGSEKLVAARKGSPLVMGVKEKNYFIASDVPAFLEHTKDVIFLDDNELVIANKDLDIINIETGKKIKKDVEKIDWDIEQAKKGNYEHYMLKEILEQSDSIKRAINQDNEKIKEMAEKINNAKGVFFVACGSSYHAAFAASYLFSHIAKKHINVVLASEFPHYEDFLTDKTLMIPISQSGETADVLEAVKVAKKKGVKVLSIINVMGSSLMRLSDHSFLMNAGPEICVLSTKSYTSQLVILTLLAYACVGKLEQGKELLNKAAEHVKDMFKDEYMERLVFLADNIKHKQHVYVIGRSLNYATALEAALKIKEVSYIHAEGFAGGELKHGSIALIEDSTPCIVFIPNDDTKEHILSNAIEVKARGGYIIGVSTENNEVFDYHIKVPDVGYVSQITNIIPIQILAYYLAVKLGCDPDKPRNLAKSVTVK